MAGQKISQKINKTVEAGIFIKLNILKKYNIFVNDKKTSVTLEPLVWELFNGIAAEQKCHVNDLCSFIGERKHPKASLASAIRVFIMAYQNIELKERE